ncbi:MAG: FHA domain-containing protein [Anaerolineae bacterium]|nr:FHA domain-containing protein [Anaerolineae bacterium]
MAYGRLDVFWPDGVFKTFALVENSVSIGRSSGNTIMLDTNTISRYHFSITHDAEQVYVTDLESVNGTFVDGVRLTGNEPRPLYGGEEIQAGHLRIIYHRIEEQPTQPITPIDETTQRIELEQPTFKLDVQGPTQAFSPGAHMSAELSLTNTAEEARRFVVEVTGIPREWVRIDRPQPEVAPNDTVQMLVNFKPLRRSDSAPGNYPVTVSVYPKDNPESVLAAHFPVRILSYSGFGIALESKQLLSGERFRLHVHNQGSGSLPVTVAGRDLSGKLRFQILSPQVTLAPGQRLMIQGDVKPQKPALFGAVRRHPFDLLVRSNDAAEFLIAVRGYFVEKPMLPSWTPYALAAGGAATLVALVALITLVFTPHPKPNISQFSAKTTQVARGSALDLSWSVTDVAGLRLSVNGTPAPATLDPQTGGTVLDTSGLHGLVEIGLVGENGDLTADASQQIYVYEPLGSVTFTVNPPVMVRYVVQNLSVSWNVPGAVTTQLTGVGAFSNIAIDATYGAEATIRNLIGIPAGPFTLTLTALDEVGNTLQQSIDIQIINPECSPAGASVTLYGGPDVRHQVVGTITTGSIVVNAQDSAGQWLRAELPGGITGWGRRTDFVCADTFNPNDLYKEVNVPTVPPPTPTSTPSVTPTPTATATLTPTRTPSPTLRPSPTATITVTSEG